jgi:primase-polymerase (primpol)-like protein
MKIQVPHCLEMLANEPRWVGWRWEERKGRRTKPPRSVVGGIPNGYARNDKPSTWAPLMSVMPALTAGTVDGIGLQLLGLAGFAAVDLQDRGSVNSMILQIGFRQRCNQAAP